MSKPTVLIVDDIELTRERLTTQLSQDFDVVGQAGSAARALQLCLELKPQLVLMDMIMPEVSGVEAIQQILHQAEVAPRIVALSGITDERIAAQALAAGAAEYLIKPIETEKLKSVLRSLVL